MEYQETVFFPGLWRRDEASQSCARTHFRWPVLLAPSWCRGEAERPRTFKPKTRKLIHKTASQISFRCTVCPEVVLGRGSFRVGARRPQSRQRRALKRPREQSQKHQLFSCCQRTCGRDLRGRLPRSRPRCLLRQRVF